MLRCCRLGTVQWELRLASHEYTLLIMKGGVYCPPWAPDSHVLASRRVHQGKGGLTEFASTIHIVQHRQRSLSEITRAEQSRNPK